MTTTVTVVGGNLFEVAAAQLGDATQWVRIALANNVTDPFLSGVTTLTIPDQDPSYTLDGVPPQ